MAVEKKHERFSYPEMPCPASSTTCQCDLPKVHNGRHMCGECGSFFD